MMATPREPFRAAVEWVASDVLLDLVARWDADVVDRAERWVRSELDALPLPVHPYTSGELVRRRSRLDVLLGAIEARRGDDARLLEASRREWVHGGTHVAYLRMLLRRGRRDHAIKLALSLLEEPCEEAPAVDALVVRTLGLPVGTGEMLDHLADRPTLEGWVALTRFWPAAERELRVRYAITRLLVRGQRPEAVFELVGTEGPIEPVADLVERGGVDPAIVVAFASELDVSERAAFVAMAARAAATRGEAFRAARYLNEARKLGRLDADLAADLAYVRAHEDEALRRALAASGFRERPGPGGRVV